MEGSEYEQLTNKGHKKVQRRKVMDLKLAFSEFYLSLILLQNYQNLNFTGFRKILKKHDKLVKNDAGGRWREDYVECAHFHTNKASALKVCLLVLRRSDNFFVVVAEISTFRYFWS